MRDLAYWKGRLFDVQSLWRQFGHYEDLRAVYLAARNIAQIELRVLHNLNEGK